MTEQYFNSYACSALAGSGKTEALASRFIGLLLLGVPLDQITAMTFAKTASGEIFERILSKLAAPFLSSSKEIDKKIDALQEQIDAEQITPNRTVIQEGRLLLLLRELALNMQRVKIGTIDSFFAGIVNAFPMELGLPGAVSILDEAAIETTRRDILRLLFSPTAHRLEGNVISETIETILESAKETADAGSESGYFRNIMSVISDLESDPVFPALSRRACEYFAKRKPPFTEEVKSAYFNIIRAIDDTNIKQKHPVLHHLVNMIVSGTGNDSTPPYGPPDNLKFNADDWKLLKALFECWDEIQNDGEIRPAGFISLFKSGLFSNHDILTIIGFAANFLIYRMGVRMSALHTMMEQYSNLYNRRLQESGQLTFADMPKLLTREDSEGWIGEISMRMNCRLKHWLIDEFQDTSRIQWRVLSSIIDSIDPLEASLYVVGDVKQAIYNWRGGDSRLFGEAAADVNFMPLPIPIDGVQTNPAQKEKSYRYGPEICEGLSLLFTEENFRSNQVPPDVIQRFFNPETGIWQKHIPDAVRTKHGCFKAVQAGGKEQEFETYAAILLTELKNLRWSRETTETSRSWETAVLVRSNSEMTKLLDAIQFLKQQEPWSSAEYPSAEDFSMEGKMIIGNDITVKAIFSFLIYVQYPSNTLARKITAMMPRWNEITNDLFHPFRCAEYDEEIYNRGFYPVIKSILNRIGVSSPETGILLNAAEEFDLSGRTRDSFDFRDFAASKSRSDAAYKNKIRLCTEHHSKGLTFDFVFTIFRPDKTNFLKPETQDMIADASTPPDNKKWGLYHPGKAVLTNAETLTAAKEKRDEKAFESICIAYVALTRSRYYTCAILPDPPAKSSSFRVYELLSNSLFGAGGAETDESTYPNIKAKVFEISCPGWLDQLITEKNDFDKQKKLQIVHFDPIDSRNFRPAPPRKRFSAPSTLEASGGEPSSGFHFARPRTDEGIEFGTRLHEFFSSIESFSGFTPPSGTNPEFVKQFELCRANPEIAALCGGSNEGIQVFREYSFCCAIGGGTILNGIFDRVRLNTVEQSAVILDYKTNRADDADAESRLISTYRRQMNAYRAAAATLFAIPSARIECCLIVTRLGRALWIPRS